MNGARPMSTLPSFKTNAFLKPLNAVTTRRDSLVVRATALSRSIRGAAVVSIMICATQQGGAFFLVPPPPSFAAASLPVLQGPARVVDGDTLVVEGQKIRLFGIDAPEKAQSCSLPSGSEYPCGLQSKAALEAKLQGKSVSCAVQTTDQYGRSVSKCTVNGGWGGLGGGGDEEINAWLVKNGLAVAYTQYGGKAYSELEREAKAEHLGVWQGSFMTPSVWRKEQKAGGGGGGAMMAAAAKTLSLPSAPPLAAASIVTAPGGGGGGGGQQCSDGSLPVKGNIDGKKNKIYHAPGQAAYDRVKIDESAGERFFCSEEEARAAGWRAASK